MTTKIIATTQSEAAQAGMLGVGDCFFKAEDTAFTNLYQMTNTPLVAVLWNTGVVETLASDAAVMKVSSVSVGAIL